MTYRSTSGTAIGFALIVSGTVLSIAGTDLVLPAVPSLPRLLGGTPAEAQFVLAAFVAGMAVGLLVFGELGSRIDARLLLAGSLATYGVLSLAGALVSSLGGLIILRLIQGVAGAAPAVLAPGLLRALFPAGGAVRAIGLMGSIESLVPALAPVAGVWLLERFGWQASFLLTGVLSLILAAVLGSRIPGLPGSASRSGTGSYSALLGNPVFLRYALSHAFTLGGLLVFVFGAPAVIIGALGGHLSDFIILQVTGIASFILATNLSASMADRFGTETMIVWGTVLSAAGTVGILVYALLGGSEPSMLIPPFLPVNIGLGLRGPPGFLRALVAADGDDARGAALVVLAILVTTACGTALAAPTVSSGLTGLAGIASCVSVGAVLCLVVGPRASRSTPSMAGPPSP